MKKLVSLMLCFALLLSMTACTGSPETTAPPETTVPPTTTEPAPDAAQIYSEAAEKVRSATSMLINYTINKEMVIGTDTYVEEETVSLSLKNPGAEDCMAAATRNLTWGEDYYSDFKEYYSEGSFYSRLDGMDVTGAMTPEDLAARYLPAVLISAELYTNVEFVDDTTVSFSGATALEPWLDEAGCELVEASGTAVLNASGTLDDCTYHVVYTQSGVTNTLDITFRTMVGTVDVNLPADVANFVSVDSPEAQLMYERVIGLTLQAKDSTSTLSENVVIEAGAASLAKQMTINSFGTGKDLKVKFDNEIVLLDMSTMTPVYSEKQEELFKNGTYTISVNGGAAQTNRGVTADLIESARLAMLTDQLPLITDFQTMSVKDLGVVSLLEFTCNEALAEYYTTALVGMIYEDPNLLNDLATDYRTEEAGGFLGIDNVTGLPTQVGIQYTGIHTIEGSECRLVYDVAQTYSFGTGASYKEITGEQLPAEEPEEKATPLLYHVTGENGEEMYLFGTIHVGDARMAYLPQELKDALAASAALAVEFDGDAFSDQLEEDEELVAQIQEHYFYTDGTTTADHISDELLYQHAMELLKATGGYFSTMEMIKPVLISNTIENAWLSFARSLSGEYGADNQLMDLAREQGIEIRNVESAEAQIAMLTGYSEELQELLLQGTLEADPVEYQMSVQELYEMWCRGDEAELTAFLNEEEDLSEMTPEEIALYEEYTYAMSTERNAGMLEVAKGYLNSGEIVFYAVGLAHLLAEDGLVNTLREAGYTVELVVYG